MTAKLRHQRTIAQSACLEGFGYWSGKDVRVEFHPAPANTGIVFVRGDLKPPRRILATHHHRIEIPRRTSLALDGARVEMVEHILASLAGLQVDNCEVWVDQPEMPGCDGSSQPFVQTLLAAGIVEQPSWRPQLHVTEVTRVGDAESWVEVRPAKTGRLTVKYQLDYGRESPIGRQQVELTVNPENFCRQLAAARTFLLEDEAHWLKQQGLGMRVTARDLLIFGPHGPLENELRFPDECVRHKALDLIGDLALAGCDLIAHVVACRSGHRLNAELVRTLRSEGRLIESWRKSA